MQMRVRLIFLLPESSYQIHRYVAKNTTLRARIYRLAVSLIRYRHKKMDKKQIGERLIGSNQYRRSPVLMYNNYSRRTFTSRTPTSSVGRICDQLSMPSTCLLRFVSAPLSSLCKSAKIKLEGALLEHTLDS